MNKNSSSFLNKWILSILICLSFLIGNTALADLGTSITLGPNQLSSIRPSEITQLEITISNSGANPLNSVAFSNSLPGTLPNGLKVAGTPTYTCTSGANSNSTPGSGTLTANLNSQSISLSGGIVPARINNIDGECVILIPVTVGSTTGSATAYTYTIANGAVTGNDGTARSNTGAVSQTVDTTAVNVPVIAKSFSNSTAIYTGAPVTLTIKVSNSNPIAIPNFNISDTFPTLGGQPLIVVAPTPNSTSTCTNGGTPPAFAPSAGATAISATGGTIAANGSCTITVAVIANQTDGAYQTSSVSNTINGTTNFSNDLGLIPANNSASISTKSPLNVSKSFAHSNMATGQSNTLTITLANTGASSLTISSFTDSPIDGVGSATYGLKISGTPTATCSSGGTPGTFAATTGNVGVTQTSNTTIAAGGNCVLTVPITGTVQNPNTPISFTNNILLNSITTTTPGVISQPASSSLTVYDTLNITKSNNPSSVAPGSVINYKVTVQNWTTSIDTNTVINDPLTNGQTFLNGTIDTENYIPVLSGTGCSGLTTSSNVGDSSAVFIITTMPSRTDAYTPGSCTISFWAMAPISASNGASLQNTLPVGSVCYNSGGTCNGKASNVTTSSIATSFLQATKSFNPAGPLVENTTTTMMIVFTNESVNTLTNVSITDNLPLSSGNKQLRIASPANASSTCGTPTITAADNSTSFTMTGATIPGRVTTGTGAAGYCFVQVNVVGPAGTYNNTATNITGTETYANNTTATFGPFNSTTATLTYTSSLSAAKTFSPIQSVVGGNSTVTVRLTNSNSLALTNLIVVDPLPTGMVIADTPGARTTCAGSPTFTAVSGASTFTMNGANLPGNDNCDVIFNVKTTSIANGATSWVNTIPVSNNVASGGIVADGGVQVQTPVIGTLLLDAVNDITIDKETNPSSLTFPGENSQLQINITNGGQTVNNLSLTDYFTMDGTSSTALNGMEISSTPNASTNCPGGTVNAVAGGTSISLTGATLSSNQSCSVNVNVTSMKVGGITNTIPAHSVTSTQGYTNSLAGVTSLTTLGNIGLTKRFTPNIVQPGGRSRLRITIYNATQQPAANMTVTDTLPTGVTIPSNPNPVTTCTGATVSIPASNMVKLTDANLSPSSSTDASFCYAEIDVLVASQGDYINTIPAGALTGIVGGAPYQNSVAASDTLHAKAPAIINKAINGFTLDTGNPSGFTTGSATMTVGVPAILTIVINNPNSAPLTSASLTDNLPNGLEVAPTPNAATTCSNGFISADASSTSVSLTGATIPANGSCNVTVSVVSNISATYTNTIPGSSLKTNENVTNQNPSSAQTVVSTPPSIAKQFSAPVILAHGTATLTIFLENSNNAPLTLTSALVDTLPQAPGSMVIAPTPNIVKSCPGTVTASAGGTTITYANGSIIPTGGCYISVNVTASTSGKYINSIPAGSLKTNLGNNQLPANATMEVSSLGFIAGKVFNDNNVVPNGTFEPGIDTFIQNSSIELHSGANCLGTLISTEATDSAGNFLFMDLNPGTYSLCQPGQPTNTINGMTTAGTIIRSNNSTGTPGVASNPTATSSQIIGIILNGDGTNGEISGSINNNFAEVITSTISGTVFTDHNNDGIQEGLDSGIPGILIQLLNNNGVVVATQTTDSMGNYSFTNLVPGTYSVREPNQPGSTINGKTIAGSVGNGGTAGTPTQPGTTPSQISNIILPPNTTTTGNNFAEVPDERIISGTVFLDYNNDGIMNNDDYGLSGQSIQLSGMDIDGNPISQNATTGSDGTFTFTNLPPGTYTLYQNSQPTNTINGQAMAGSTGGFASNPTATTSQIAGIDLTGINTISSGNNFAEQPIAAPDLTLSKTHSPTTFGQGSSTGSFTITPQNVGSQASTGTITIVDTLPLGMTVAIPATGNGWSCNGPVGATTITCTTTNVISAGQLGNPITLFVQVASGTSGQILTNTAVISGGGEPAGFAGNNTATDAVAISNSAIVSGTVWRDLNHNRILDAGEPGLQGWIVELLLNGEIVESVTTNVSGQYNFTNISPGSGYQIRFRDPATGAIYGRAATNEQGIVPVNGVRDTGYNVANTGINNGNPAGANLSSGDGTLENLSFLANDIITQQSLPVDPSGVVYDSLTRAPISGAQVTISGPAGFNPATELVGGASTVTTGADGAYQFLLKSNAPAGVYTLSITQYPNGYISEPSSMIPACNNTIIVASNPNPAVIQASNTAPASTIPNQAPNSCPTSTANLTASNQATTQYYYSFNYTPTTSASVINNNIPLDPYGSGDIVITKTSPLVNVNIGQLVPYTITVKTNINDPINGINILDIIPSGFKYKTGSATVDGVPQEPSVSGRNLTWTGQNIAIGVAKVYKMLLVVGSGVQPGDYTNTAQATSNTGILISNIATAVVRVIPDPLFDCTEIIGKVFDDKNANGYQDEGEPGIANVRLVTVNGLTVTTDSQGRFHIACAIIPNSSRGSNFVLKLDERTLPTGYRLTTENPHSVRVTKGKMVKMNFGASIHKVIRVDMKDNAFKEDSTELNSKWADKLNDLPLQFKAQPSVVRISYSAGAKEDEDLSRGRLKEVANKLKEIWEEKNCCHLLQIEEELILHPNNLIREDVK